MRGKCELNNLKNLGSGVTYYETTYDKGLLEKIENKFKENDYMVSLDAYEFTCCCPKTGQPDFAKFYISYVPSDYLVESKSLKLYLFSYRNSGLFHEDVVNMILNDLVELLDPKYIEVNGIFSPRGGIAIYPFASYAKKDGGYEDMKKKRQLANVSNIIGSRVKYN